MVRENLKVCGYSHDDIMIISVPGSFEIVQTVGLILKKESSCGSSGIVGIVCIGIILKGNTAHFEYLSSSVSQTLCDLSSTSDIPIINGVLICYNAAQIEEKASEDNAPRVAAEWSHALETQVSNYETIASHY